MDRPEKEKRTVYMSNPDREIRQATGTGVRKVMEVIETYTNYNELEDIPRNIVRDTILNQLNMVARVAKHKNTMVFEQQAERE